MDVLGRSRKYPKEILPESGPTLPEFNDKGERLYYPNWRSSTKDEANQDFVEAWMSAVSLVVTNVGMQGIISLHISHVMNRIAIRAALTKTPSETLWTPGLNHCADSLKANLAPKRIRSLNLATGRVLR
jgi:hypothetical protein